MDNRDNFSAQTKKAIAGRAGYQCTICRVTTIGPAQNDEKPISIGVAAHIYAASKGGPRYCDKMSKEERSNISNAIWVCPIHSTIIDRDIDRYPASELLRLKGEHETKIYEMIGGVTSTSTSHPNVLIALGQDLILIGKLRELKEKEWDLYVDKFLIGDSQTLNDFSINFRNNHIYDRFVIVSELGYGRLLSDAPKIKQIDSGYSLSLRVGEQHPNISSKEILGDLMLDNDDDLLIENGDLRIIRGVEALPQLIKRNLTCRRGEWFLNSKIGSKVSEYFALLADSVWLIEAAKLEVIRMSSIPLLNGEGQPYLPIPSISRVLSVEELPTSESGKLNFCLNIELEDKKKSQFEISILL